VATTPQPASQTPNQFPEDSQHKPQIVTTQYVVCRECDKKFRRLNGGHLAAKHNMTIEEYRTRWPGAPITCPDLRKNASRRTKKQMEAVRGRPRPELRSVRGHTGEGPLKPWPVICRVVQEHSYAALESEFGRDFSTVADCARKRGISGKPCVYDFGKLFDTQAVQHLKKCTGLSATQMANEIGLPEPAVAELVRPNRAGQRVHPATAKKIIAWRDHLIEKLLATASKPDRVNDRYSGSRVLRTLFPDLRARHKLLLNVLGKLRMFLLREASAGADEMGEHFCAEAMLEVSQGSSQKTFATFLPWAPDLMPFLEENIGRIRRPGNLWPVAEEAIARRWNTTRAVVNGTRKARARTIPPGELRHLVQVRADSGGTAGSAAPKRRGGQRGDRRETLARITVAAHYGLKGVTQYAMAPILYPRHKESAEGARNAANQFFRSHRDGLGREKARLATLSEMERKAQVEIAEQGLQ
jgi:hypothetical protein